MREPGEKLSHALIEAYRATCYRLFLDAQSIDLYIDQSSPALDACLRSRGVECAAFLTAWNPRSQSLSRPDNHARQQQLCRELEQAGYACLPGEGRDMSGHWEAEESLLALGLDRVSAHRMALRYGQHAYVYLKVGRPAELILLSEDARHSDHRGDGKKFSD